MSNQYGTNGHKNLKRVTAVAKRPYGVKGGLIDVFTLSCGHQVEHIGRRDLTVGKLTRCEECK